MSGVDIDDVSGNARHRRDPSLWRAVIAALFIMAGFLGGLLLASKAHAYDPYNYGQQVEDGGYRCWNSNVDRRYNAYVIGDSITWRGAETLAGLRPGWYVEGVPGRKADCLSRQVSGILAVDTAPRLVVIALGTNASAENGVALRDYYTVYREAVALLPASTRVALVTPYRDPIYNTIAGSDAGRAYHQWHYAKAMTILAVDRPSTCIVPWRVTAARHPEYMNDGIHPNVKGIPVWARLLARTC